MEPCSPNTNPHRRASKPSRADKARLTPGARDPVPRHATSVAPKTQAGRGKGRAGAVGEGREVTELALCGPAEPGSPAPAIGKGCSAADWRCPASSPGDGSFGFEVLGRLTEGGGDLKGDSTGVREVIRLGLKLCCCFFFSWRTGGCLRMETRRCPDWVSGGRRAASWIKR